MEHSPLLRGILLAFSISKAELGRPHCGTEKFWSACAQLLPHVQLCWRADVTTAQGRD